MRITLASFYILLLFTLQLTSIKTEVNEKEVLEGIIELFAKYHKIFQKSYEIKSVEGLKRFQIFSANLNFIQKVNNDPKKKFKLGISKFTDITNDEYKLNVLRIEPKAKSDNKNTTTEDVKRLEEADIISYKRKIDWTRYMNPIKDQLQCPGAAIYFALLGAIEGQYNSNNSAFGTKVHLSEQYLIDCLGSRDICSNKNDNEESLEKVLDFILDKGVVRKENYPYVGEKFECKKNLDNFRVVASWTSCKKCHINTWTKMLLKSPVFTYIDASSPYFQHYESGLLELEPEDCDYNNAKTPIVVVGTGKDKNGVFYKLRNSWGNSWGESGYVMIKKNDKTRTCGVNDYARIFMDSDDKIEDDDDMDIKKHSENDKESYEDEMAHGHAGYHGSPHGHAGYHGSPHGNPHGYHGSPHGNPHGYHGSPHGYHGSPHGHATPASNDNTEKTETAINSKTSDSTNTDSAIKTDI